MLTGNIINPSDVRILTSEGLLNFSLSAQTGGHLKIAANDDRSRRHGAGNRTRTDDLRITNALLYQLSHTSKIDTKLLYQQFF